MAEPMIRLVDLHKSFGPKKVLCGVNLDVHKGETMVIIGGSGSGKSVILKHIIGLMRPDRGRVVVAGKDLSVQTERGLDELRKKFGMLFQGSALFDSLRVWENVGFALRHQTRMREEQVREIAHEKLAMVGLQDVDDRMPSELSGGMKKRVGLARAIATEPEILLYDEPTTGLDPIMSDAINDLIVEMKKNLNVTGVAITHDMASAYKIGDRIAMLYQGRIEEIGTPEEIKSSRNPVVRQFITGSAAGPIKTVY